MEITEELKPEITRTIASKMKLLCMRIIRESENIGENSYKELVSAYRSLKSVIYYMEIEE